MVWVLYFAESIKDAVEKHQHSAAGNLGNVVEGLAGIVTHAGVLVLEASQNRLHQLWEMHPNRSLQGIGCGFEKK